MHIRVRLGEELLDGLCLQQSTNVCVCSYYIYLYLTGSSNKEPILGGGPD